MLLLNGSNKGQKSDVAGSITSILFENPEETAEAIPKIDLTPLYQGELPILTEFMSIISAGEDQDVQSLWDNMLGQFGKVELGLDLKTGCMIKTNYATVTRIN